MKSRKAVPADAPHIADIHVRSWQVAYRDIVPSEYLAALSVAQRERTWQKILTGDTTETWLLEDGAKVVGWISVGPSRDADAAPSTRELYAIYVDPSHWGGGIGSRLWAETEIRMRSNAVSSVTLWVLKENARALRFYQSQQFVVDDAIEKTVQLGGADLVEIRLRKTFGH